MCNRNNFLTGVIFTGLVFCEITKERSFGDNLKITVSVSFINNVGISLRKDFKRKKKILRHLH